MGMLRAHLIFPLLLGTLALHAKSAVVDTYDWYYVNLDDDHVEIYQEDQSRDFSAIPSSTSGDLEVPKYLGGRIVVSIGENAFRGCSKLTSVTLPDSVTNIAGYAFCGCSSLTNIVVPSGLRSIGAYAFTSCNALARLDLNCSELSISERAFRDDDALSEINFSGESLSLGERAFFGCGGLKGITIEARQVNIGTEAFYGGYDSKTFYGYCESLTNVVINATQSATIGQSAFSSCGALAKVNVSAGSSTAIGESAFSDCSGLRTILLPEPLTVIQTNAFRNCSSLESVSFSTNLTTICYRAFDTCTSLTSVSFKNGVSIVEPQAFYGCTSLTQLVFPSSVETIGKRAFEKCTALTNVTFTAAGTNEIPRIVTFESQAFNRCSSLETVCLPTDMAEIGEDAFLLCSALREVLMPTNLDTIAESAFEGCSSLPFIELPETLFLIGRSAFADCSSLTGFVIPTNNTVSVGSKAFYGTLFWETCPNNSLVVNNGYLLGFKGNPTTVTLPDTCKAINEGMFENMTNLVEVVIPDSVQSIGSRAFAGTGVRSLDLSGATTLGVSACEGCSFLTNVCLATGLTTIPDSAFKSCQQLSSIIIPKKVETIGAYAFSCCSNLVTVTGGEGVSRVNDGAFSFCASLEPFRFSDGVSYGIHVFQDVRWTEYVLFPSVGTLQDEYPDTYQDIRSVIIPASITSIVSRAFSGCAALSGTIVIPEGVTSLGEAAFAQCAALTSIEMPSSLMTVGTNAFAGCTAIQSVVLSGNQTVASLFPERFSAMKSIAMASGATSICASMLEGCSSITSFDIPIGVTSIGERAFAGCTGLSYALTIPDAVTSIGAEAFAECTGLKTVRYLGDMPTVGTNIYMHTSGSLITGVLKENESSWASSGKLPAYWPSGDAYRRPTGWWVGATWAVVRFEMGDGENHYQKILADGLHSLAEEDLPEIPDREGYECDGNWYLAASGGDPVEFPMLVIGSMNLYLHWSSDEDPEDEGEGATYDFDSAGSFRGYLTDGESLVGTVEIKAAKGTTNRSSGETTAKLTATVQMLGEARISLKGTLTDDLTAVLTPTKKSDTREMNVTIVEGGSLLTLEGDFDGYEIVASRDVFSGKTSSDLSVAARLGAFAGTYALAFVTDGGNGVADETCFGISVKLTAKGKATVSGILPDGTRLSSSAQAFWSDDQFVIPVVLPAYTGKRGGLSFALSFDSDGTASVSDCSPWIVTGKTEAEMSVASLGVSAVGSLDTSLAYGVQCDADFALADETTQSELAPSAVTSFAATAKGWTLPRGDTVQFSKVSGEWEITKDNGNPVSLKLTYTKSTGLFKGSFTVYSVTTAGKSKKRTATVNGVMVGNTGYGHAYIKNVGSVPFTIENGL